MSVSLGFEMAVAGATFPEIRKSFTATGGLQLLLDESIADGQTNKQVNVTLDVSAVQGFYLVSDQDVLFEPNDGATPDDPISLLAGIPYFWHTSFYESFFFGTDWTEVFITNASGASARVQAYGVIDPTP